MRTSELYCDTAQPPTTTTMRAMTPRTISTAFIMLRSLSASRDPSRLPPTASSDSDSDIRQGK